MNGQEIKLSLITNNIDINNYNYFENDKIYNINEIPNMKVSKEKLLEKLTIRLGEKDSKYIINKIYQGTENKVDPLKILNIFDK